MEGERKYFTEIGLGIFTEGSAVFRPSVMAFEGKMNSTTQGVLDDASIYFVCSRPRLRVNPRSIARTSSDLHYELVLHVEDGAVAEYVTISGFFDRYEDVGAVRIHEAFSFNVELMHKGGDESRRRRHLRCAI